ncbi:MAG: glycosyltransferase [Lachnospiraceae bacterium]|nr:glycosyltransferase [Lachnospiraceae bacterium]
MKILFHLNSMGRGGAERVVSILARAFAEKGDEVIVATQWYSENEYELGEKVRRISVGLTEADEKCGRVKRAWIRLWRLRDCIRQERPDLVISFCNKANFRSAFSLIGMKIPLLVSVRNDPKKDYAPYKLPTWLMEKKTAGCVFQTPEAQRFFAKKLQEKSCIIFNPLSENYLEDSNENKICVRKPEIVTVGRISRQKNQILLLQAFANVQKKYPDYVIKIYGDIQDEAVHEELQKYIKKEGLEAKVLFMGISDSTKEEIRDAALFVLPSDYEGMPNALIEAMAMGIPSISTDCPCGGSAMLMEHKVSGMLVPVGDGEAMEQALCYMLDNKERAERMGEEAKKILEKVHPQVVCRQWEEYIGKIMQNKR